jgi:hypothetical protein
MDEQCVVVSGSWSLKRGEGLAMESENGLAVAVVSGSWSLKREERLAIENEYG